MKSKDNVIDLEDYRVIQGDKISKVFTGRDRGKDVRIKSKIDEIEKIYDKVIVIIPDKIYSINPSFFEEFLVNVVTKLGVEEFKRKFKIQSIGDYDFEGPLEEALNRIIRNKTAIG